MNIQIPNAATARAKIDQAHSEALTRVSEYVAREINDAIDNGRSNVNLDIEPRHTEIVAASLMQMGYTVQSGSNGRNDLMFHVSW